MRELWLAPDRARFLFLEVAPIAAAALALTTLLDSWMYGTCPIETASFDGRVCAFDTFTALLRPPRRRPSPRPTLIAPLVSPGRLVFVPLEFFRFNVVNKGSSLYGTHPWHWYLSQARHRTNAHFLSDRTFAHVLRRCMCVAGGGVENVEMSFMSADFCKQGFPAVAGLLLPAAALGLSRARNWWPAAATAGVTVVRRCRAKRTTECPPLWCLLLDVTCHLQHTRIHVAF